MSSLFLFFMYICIGMKNLSSIIISSLFIIPAFCSCSDDNEPVAEEEFRQPEPVEMTLLMYMPWSQTLTSDLANNMYDMQRILARDPVADKKVVVFFSTSGSDAQLIEITNGSYDILKTYSSITLNTVEGIASIIADVKSLAPANHYAMTIGCHGTGWLPAGALEPYINTYQTFKLYSTAADAPQTRYFGGISRQWQTDVSTLAQAIEHSGTHLEYLVFDACYMGGVEVAYELRNVADVTVLSAAEIMSAGIPYKSIGRMLLDDAPDWNSVCNKFKEYYSNYLYPYGTLAAIDSSSLEQLAQSMKSINSQYSWNDSWNSNLQSFGGFAGEKLFYDLGEYVDIMTAGNDSEFRQSLANSVIAAVHTGRYYVAYQGTYPITHFCGLSCSAPSSSAITQSWPSTQWAKATTNP